MLPRVSWIVSLRKGLYEIELADWVDANFPTHEMIVWCEEKGVYCLAETSSNLDNYSQLLFPGFGTTCFEDMPYSTYVDQMKG